MDGRTEWLGLAAELEDLLERLCDLSVTLPEAAGLRARMSSLLEQLEHLGATLGSRPADNGNPGAAWPVDKPAAPVPADVSGRLGGRSRDVRVAIRGGGLVLSGRCPSLHAKQVVQHEISEFYGLPVVHNGIDVHGLT
jgi:hypothetical protein